MHQTCHTGQKGTIGNLTFYAKWQINKYKIKYDGNGATSGSMKGVSVCQYGKTYTLTKNKFKRTGYVFEGWNTKKNGKGDFYEDGEDIRNITAKTVRQSHCMRSGAKSSTR